MNIRQIRNATIVVQYAGKNFLIDPVLADKGTYPPFGPRLGYPDAPRQDQNNPLINLPASLEEIINVDAVIATHLHLDHFDPAAKEILPKDIKMFVQDEKDAKELQDTGFINVEILNENTHFEGIKLSKTKGQHGSGEILKMAGNVCGIIFNHSSEKTLYVAGDTIWYEGIKEVIETQAPEVIVLNAGRNKFLDTNPLIMGKEDVYEVYKAAPNAKIIASHMEAVNHWTLSREELKNFINEKNISSNVLVPDDGESYTF
ncbi:MBL fold metallo-hydrolase [Clostridium sp. SHJSY1]|uniref:MBL fold metallo-hydrolase n=1 Tax=Clostridium sp. SHJSY1 TaxID=2942483 RepID=UPI0028754C0B|nr:MBL fold metallo-hydrolase [Clostridium sp. SHJSY1]MDS0525242.1 MBL fold metallo-hydrolase [Clostridium sp. SHJSY1]